MSLERSESLYKEAGQVLVGGVNSPVRAFKSVGGSPIFISHGEGPHIVDVDGNSYVDLVGSYGPLILGHAPAEVNQAIKAALDKGATFGASSAGEVELAKLVQEAFPGMQKVRFVNSGTEAVMSAIRLVRAFTGKSKIIKFSGCYHGHSDYLLAQAGSGLLTLSLPGSAGVPAHVVQDTLIANYNDIEGLHKIFEEYGSDIAAVLMEPVPGNMGVVLPQDEFLRQVRDLTYKYDTLLVFDEVMSGFRERFGGAQHFYKVEPDLTCLGKIIGGGLPVGAYGGRREIMDMVAPLGPVYQAGTLSGNPAAMAGGIAMLTRLRDDRSVYEKINNWTASLAEGITKLGTQYNVPVQVAVFGSMITPFFTDKLVTDYASATSANTERFARVFWNLIENGVYPPPSQFEAWFVSVAHGDAELEAVLHAFEKAFRNL